MRAVTHPCAKALGPVASNPANSNSPPRVLLVYLIVGCFWDRRDNNGLADDRNGVRGEPLENGGETDCLE